jgi:hypothetical protein
MNKISPRSRYAGDRRPSYPCLLSAPAEPKATSG